MPHPACRRKVPGAAYLSDIWRAITRQCILQFPRRYLQYKHVVFDQMCSRPHITFTIGTTRFVYTNFELNTHVIIDGTDYPTTMTLDGNLDTNVATSNKGSDTTGNICLFATTGEGSAVITALGSSITEELGVGGDFV